MPESHRPFGELRRLFYRRFFENDLLSPTSGAEGLLASVFALLIAPGLFLPVRRDKPAWSREWKSPTGKE